MTVAAAHVHVDATHVARALVADDGVDLVDDVVANVAALVVAPACDIASGAAHI